MVMIVPFGLPIRTAPCSSKDRQRFGCQNAWQTAFLTPIHLSWQGIATHVDATETDTDYRLRVDLPGFSAEEVDIELQGDRLSITANKAESDAGKARSVAFARSFGLPDNVRQDDISASLDKGVLTVTLPKATPTVQTEPKTVPVQAGPAKPAAAEAGEAPAEGTMTGSAQEQCTYRPWGRCRK